MTADASPDTSPAAPGEALSPEAQDAPASRTLGGSYAQDALPGGAARRSQARTDQHTPDTDEAPELARAVEGEVDGGEGAISPNFHIEPKNP